MRRPGVETGAAGVRSAELPSRLRACREELEDAILARARSVADPSEVGDADYVCGLRDAVHEALEHAIDALEKPLHSEEPIPPQLAKQASLAARRGVSLDTVLRRYVAGHALLCQYLLQEAGEVSPKSLRSALRTEAALLDRVIVEVSGAYVEETERSLRTVGRRRTEQVKRLLAGEPVETAELGYDLDLWHLGVTAMGVAAKDLLGELATSADRRLFVVQSGREETWAWLGGRRRLDAEEIADRASESLPAGVAIAIGEPGRGAMGFRLTHRQAAAALPVALRGDDPFVRYADVALLASIVQDDLLATSLQRLYLAPLGADRDGGETLRETLRAYFAADRNVSSTAAALGVDRHTVTSRLRAVEQRLDRPLTGCAAALEAALALHQQLGDPAAGAASPSTLPGPDDRATASQLGESSPRHPPHW